MQSLDRASHDLFGNLRAHIKADAVRRKHRLQLTALPGRRVHEFYLRQIGTRGGIGVQIGKPAGQDVYIGFKEGDRTHPAPLRCLPFFLDAGAAVAGAEFLVEQTGTVPRDVAGTVVPWRREQISRSYGWSTDRWETDGLAFSIFTPFGGIPDPDVAAVQQMRDGIRPAVVAELEIDNTSGDRPRTAFFALGFGEAGWIPLEAAGTSRTGFSFRGQLGVLGEIVDGVEGEKPTLFCRFTPVEGLNEPVPHRLGWCPGLSVEVPSGQKRTLRLAMGVYLGDVVTTGHAGRYLYAHYFNGLSDVLTAALDAGDPIPNSSAIDDRLLRSGLSADRQFLIAHATRSYYGSTQLLRIGGRPFWVVNEGEYCMMNTLDLSVDQMFWELRFNPWVVRNLLEQFIQNYSYVDRLNGPGGKTLPGGISFTHDMGTHNNFMPQGQSSYELPNLNAACFSHMTAEQLCNWVLIAATYVIDTADVDWAIQHQHLLLACLQSLERRGGDSATPEFDSDRCGSGGAEITTYDSLDHSLAQTRNSLYMSVKFWAAFRGLAAVFEKIGPEAGDARSASLERAACAARTLLRHVGEDGVIPAVFEPDSSGFRSRILPGCEGLIYPCFWGLDAAAEAPELYAALRRHTLTLLDDPEHRNAFADGGIKLSSTSNNSWMSKIAIVQAVVENVLGLCEDPAMAAMMARADAAHVRWQTDGSGYWACSDQFVNGVAKGSRYYPRIVSTILWMQHS